MKKDNFFLMVTASAVGIFIERFIEGKIDLLEVWQSICKFWFLICKYGVIPLSVVIFIMLVSAAIDQIGQWMVGKNDTQKWAECHFSKVKTLVYALFLGILLFGMLVNLSIIPPGSVNLEHYFPRLHRMIKTIEEKTYTG